jgi:Flp pilus assembly protein TadG
MRISGVSQRICGFGRRLARDERGAVLIYVSIALTVFMGFAALVIDGGRLFTLDTEMQSAADALALAGAAELDGNTDAITRATAAMDNLVQNNQTFGTGAAAITGYTPIFLTDLPADSQPLSDVEAFATTDGASARFVEVKLTDANDRAIDTMFAPAIGGDSTADADAVAIAGFTSAVCKFTPLFICNPYEDDGIDTLPEFTAMVEDPAEQRRLITLKKGPGGGNTAYFPGNFGFLQPQDGRGANALRDSLGKVDPGACFRQDGVQTRTGNVISVRQAVNARFDVYDGNYNSKKNDADYRPAENVTKGYLKMTGNRCSQEIYSGSAVPPPAMAFPGDDCSTGGCASLGGQPNRMGNGDWDFGKYWDVNHGNRNGNITDDGAYPEGWTDANPPSRYQVYRWEIGKDANGDPILSSDPNGANIPDNSSVSGEDGAPACSDATATPDPDRRILYAAVLNCGALDIQGSSTDTVPALAFVKMFITKPMTKLPGSGNCETCEEDGDLLVEMVDVVKPGIDQAVIHDIVQLYR